MTERRKGAIRLGLLGVFYGTVLAIDGVLCAGAGHGTYVPLALYGAPLSLLGIPGSVFGPPIFWGAVGLLLVRRSPRTDWAARVLLGTHYLVGVLGWSGVLGGDFADWEYLNKSFSKVLPVLAFGVVVYAVGQVWIWRRFSERSSDLASQRT